MNGLAMIWLIVARDEAAGSSNISQRIVNSSPYIRAVSIGSYNLPVVHFISSSIDF